LRSAADNEQCPAPAGALPMTWGYIHLWPALLRPVESDPAEAAAQPSAELSAETALATGLTIGGAWDYLRSTSIRSGAYDLRPGMLLSDFLPAPPTTFPILEPFLRLTSGELSGPLSPGTILYAPAADGTVIINPAWQFTHAFGAPRLSTASQQSLENQRPRAELRSIWPVVELRRKTAPARPPFRSSSPLIRLFQKAAAAAGQALYRLFARAQGSQ
jgi:hypothetical protein